MWSEEFFSIYKEVKNVAPRNYHTYVRNCRVTPKGAFRPYGKGTSVVLQSSKTDDFQDDNLHFPVIRCYAFNSKVYNCWRGQILNEGYHLQDGDETDATYKANNMPTITLTDLQNGTYRVCIENDHIWENNGEYYPQGSMYEIEDE